MRYTHTFIKLSYLIIIVFLGCKTSNKKESENKDTAQKEIIKKEEAIQNPLITHMYTADPSAHVLNGKLYIYPSHDIESTVTNDEEGNHFNMKDYHVFSMDSIPGEVIDYGKALDVKQVAWAKKQLWAPDAAEKNGTYYLYFPAKDSENIFRIGVATSKKPTGPFTPLPNPIPGSFSIDPSVFKDNDGSYYMYFGGIMGGQLQRWTTGVYLPKDEYPANDSAALSPKIAKLATDMVHFETPPKDVQILDKEGNPIRTGDHDRRFFEAAWMHKYQGKYYFSYSTGDTHKIVYATATNPYGPFTYQGVILKPVIGWTNHHSIVKYKGKWYLFYHDSSLANGQTHLRCVKVVELHYNTDGSIQTIDPLLK